MGSYVGGIDVSVELENGDAWLCCGLNYLRFIRAGKAVKDWGWRWAMVAGIGGYFWLSGSD